MVFHFLLLLEEISIIPKIDIAEVSDNDHHPLIIRSTIEFSLNHFKTCFRERNVNQIFWPFVAVSAGMESTETRVQYIANDINHLIKGG